MTTIVLTRKQVAQLGEIADKFPNGKWFKLTEDNRSGIGPSHMLTYDAFEEQDTTVNITDVSTW